MFVNKPTTNDRDTQSLEKVRYGWLLSASFPPQSARLS